MLKKKKLNRSYFIAGKCTAIQHIMKVIVYHENICKHHNISAISPSFIFYFHGISLNFTSSKGSWLENCITSKENLNWFSWIELMLMFGALTFTAMVEVLRRKEVTRLSLSPCQHQDITLLWRMTTKDWFCFAPNHHGSASAQGICSSSVIMWRFMSHVTRGFGLRVNTDACAVQMGGTQVYVSGVQSGRGWAVCGR